MSRASNVSFVCIQQIGSRFFLETAFEIDGVPVTFLFPISAQQAALLRFLGVPLCSEATIEFTGGTGPISGGQCNTPVNITGVLRDGNGNPIPNTLVNLSVDGTTGTAGLALSSPTATTDASGNFSVQGTYTGVGTVTLTAAAVVGGTSVSTTVTVTVDCPPTCSCMVTFNVNGVIGATRFSADTFNGNLQVSRVSGTSGAQAFLGSVTNFITSTTCPPNASVTVNVSEEQSDIVGAAFEIIITESGVTGTVTSGGQTAPLTGTSTITCTPTA